MRQFPPLAARMDKVKQGIEQLTLLLRRTAIAFSSRFWKHAIHMQPFFVGQVD
jgi:hypothetical protein